AKATFSSTTGIKVPAKPARYRTLHKFWLDLNTIADANLNDCIDNLKRYRMFTPTIRDGIRLVVSLRERSFDVLFELFPWVCDWLENEIERRVSARVMDRAGDIDDMKLQLAKLEALLLTPQPTAGQGPKAMSIPTIPGPADDDDDVQLVVTKAKGSNGQASMNFLNSVNNLQK